MPCMHLQRTERQLPGRFVPLLPHPGFEVRGDCGAHCVHKHFFIARQANKSLFLTQFNDPTHTRLHSFDYVSDLVGGVAASLKIALTPLPAQAN